MMCKKQVAVLLVYYDAAGVCWPYVKQNMHHKRETGLYKLSDLRILEIKEFLGVNGFGFNVKKMTPYSHVRYI